MRRIRIPLGPRGRHSLSAALRDALLPRLSAVLRSLPLLLLAGVLSLPVLALLGAWLPWGEGGASAWAVLREMASTVLPGYVGTTLWLCLWVGLGAAVVGSAAAAAVTLFDFPGRRAFEWLLLLPLAMPAYVTAYAYTDFLQFSGPLQVWLRARTGATGALWPDIRSTGGAVVLFILTLYPYVYLLTRTALTERGAVLMEAARLLGAGPWRRLTEVALPMARPALAAGVALALMETLADYGVGAYFGLNTFTTGIYKAWLSFGDPMPQRSSPPCCCWWWACWCGWSGARSRGCASRPPAGRAAARRLGRCSCRAPRPGRRWRPACCRCCWASCCRWRCCCAW